MRPMCDILKGRSHRTVVWTGTPVGHGLVGRLDWDMLTLLVACILATAGYVTFQPRNTRPERCNTSRGLSRPGQYRLLPSLRQPEYANPATLPEYYALPPEDSQGNGREYAAFRHIASLDLGTVTILPANCTRRRASPRLNQRIDHRLAFGTHVHNKSDHLTPVSPDG